MFALKPDAPTPLVSQIVDGFRRLIADRHEVHLYACRHDAVVLPTEMHCHPIAAVRGPRFLRPWRFGAAWPALLSGRPVARHSSTPC